MGSYKGHLKYIYRSCSGETIVPKHNLSYILGNPPFLGARVMEKEQSAELAMLFSGVKNAGNLDYVTGWYKKAAEYIQGTQIE